VAALPDPHDCAYASRRSARHGVAITRQWYHAPRRASARLPQSLARCCQASPSAGFRRDGGNLNGGSPALEQCDHNEGAAETRLCGVFRFCAIKLRSSAASGVEVTVSFRSQAASTDPRPGSRQHRRSGASKFRQANWPCIVRQRRRWIRTSGAITSATSALQIWIEATDQILRFRAQHFPGRDCQDEKDRFTLASLNVNQWSLMTLTCSLKQSGVHRCSAASLGRLAQFHQRQIDLSIRR